MYWGGNPMMKKGLKVLLCRQQSVLTLSIDYKAKKQNSD
jgi:hypothetical protein